MCRLRSWISRAQAVWSAGYLRHVLTELLRTSAFSLFATTNKRDFNCGFSLFDIRDRQVVSVP